MSRTQIQIAGFKQFGPMYQCDHCGREYDITDGITTVEELQSGCPEEDCHRMRGENEQTATTARPHTPTLTTDATTGQGDANER